jgi:hypothetical protein
MVITAVQVKSFKKTRQLAQDYAIFYNQNLHTPIVMFAVQNWKSGAMKTKQHAPAVAPNGNAPTKTQPVFHTANTPINAEQ